MAGGPEQCSICLEALDGGVTALACGHRFHAACLAQMSGAVGTAARTSRRGTLTACPNCRTVSRVAPLAPIVEAFSVGDSVQALYGNQWYPGVVRGVINSGRAYEITWGDGEEGDVFAAHVRAEAPAPVPPARTVATTTTGRSEGGDSSDDEEEDWSPRAPERRSGGGSATGVDRDGGARTTSSRFWGVSWIKGNKKWQARYLDADGKYHSIGYFVDEEEAARAVNKAICDAGLEGRRKTNAVDATGALVPRERNYGGDRSAVVAPDPARDPSETTSRFWGVSWDRKSKKWMAYYKDADGKQHNIGLFNNQESAARARDQAIRDAGLEGQRRMNAADATGSLVPRAHTIRRDRSDVVAPDPARAPTAPTSKFWGVNWDKSEQRWKASYSDANKQRTIGHFDTQEAAAHAVNAAIRALPPDVQRRRKTNPVVDGQLVPKPPGPHNKKRRRDEPAAAAPTTRPRN